jgi:acyl-CoA synthetase (AMP-forming)/AMP-acid ligase II
LLTYNLSQFAGIQILLHALVSHATLVVPPSRRPNDAIATIREHGVTHVSATPTFWGMLTRALDGSAAATLDLRQATLGGEAVPERVLSDIARLFPNARISQVYAATEFGSGISVRDGRIGLPISVLDRDDDADVQMRIIDGELHVRSTIGMFAYYAQGRVDGGWRPTGDRVEVRGDRIFFVGRSTDLINVGGEKVHPLPLENLLIGLDDIDLVRAYAHPNPITGQIVAVDVVARPGADTARLEEEIRSRCAALTPAGRPRRIRFVPNLAVQGDKIARQSAGARESAALRPAQED